MVRDRGLHNAVKCKTLMILYNNKVAKQHDQVQMTNYCGGNWIEGMTARDIHEASGVRINTLCRSLPKWCHWGLVNRFATSELGNKHHPSRQYEANTSEKLAWAYTITEKGERWLRDYADEQLNVERFRQELRRWQTERRKELMDRARGNEEED